MLTAAEDYNLPGMGYPPNEKLNLWRKYTSIKNWKKSKTLKFLSSMKNLVLNPNTNSQQFVQDLPTRFSRLGREKSFKT